MNPVQMVNTKKGNEMISAEIRIENAKYDIACKLEKCAFDWCMFDDYKDSAAMRVAEDKAAALVGLMKILTCVSDDSLIYEYVYKTRVDNPLYSEEEKEEYKQALQEWNYHWGTCEAFEW